MTDDRIAKLEVRDKAMRAARDEILQRVGTRLIEIGFSRVGAGHFTRAANDLTCHIGFQKLSSGRRVRVMCSIDKDGHVINGPWSDPYECPDSPNGTKYQFGWSTREVDIAKCSEEYCRYIDDVVISWFGDQAESN